MGAAARRLVRLFASRFIIHGEAREALQALAYLGRHGRFATFNLLGERILSDQEAEQHQRRYRELVRELGRHTAAGARTPGGMPTLQISIKPSSLVADFNPADPEGTVARARPLLEEILEEAQHVGIAVSLDMEHYEYRELTWHLFTRIFGPHGRFPRWDGAGMVLQAYLVEAEQHARDVVAFARGRGTPFQVRLVKGAYWDYEVAQARQMGWPVPVFLDKAATDQSFERLLWLFLEAYPHLRLAVGSHNLRSHAYAEAVREHLGLPQPAVEHQTLFRMAEGTSRALAAMGWVVRDYVPSGALLPGMAYLVRRILENASLEGFLMRSRRLGHDPQELLRPREVPMMSEAAASAPATANTFRNHPPQRLFVAAEREPFPQALRQVEGRWGEKYPLHLGREVVYTKDLAPSLNPSHPDTQRPVGWVHLAGPAEVQRAIQLANEAFSAWLGRSVAERAAILRRAAELMKAARDERAAWIVHEGGKNWEGALADVDEAIDYLVYYADQALRIEQAAPDRYLPRGVVAVIPPWNFPLAIPCGMTSAALVTGNTVILKPAGPTPIITHHLVELLHRAGVPPEALIHLPGSGGTVGQALVASPEVDMVAFTGSREVGTRIYQTVCGVLPRRGGIKRALTEMGGKNAIVVFPDGDLDEAIQGILQSAFAHANQKCSACSRVFAHHIIYGRLKERLIHAVGSLRAGPAEAPGTFINPVITEEAQERIRACARTARTEGRVLVDGMGEGNDEGYLLRPLLVELPPERLATSATAQEEIFGPVLALVPFATEEEVVALVNGTVYALTAGIFSRSPQTVARMIERIRAGNIYINRPITGARVGLEPFGGFQMSGTGPKAGGEEYLYAFLTRRAGYQGREVPPKQGVAPTAWEGPEVWPWDGVSGEERARVLAVALARLRSDVVHTELQQRGRATAGAIAAALALVARVVGQAATVTAPQPTIPVPGQKTYITWTTPRGRGVVATGRDTSLATLCGLIFGSLLAGNGSIVVPQDTQRAPAEIIVHQLYQAGVPRTVLALGPKGCSGTAAKLAAGPLEFVATDLSLEETRAIYRALGVVATGQSCLKALIATAEGPLPGEPGFLRQFALPKTIAIRTLRHGADLELL